jgi:acetyltransferase
VFFAPESVAVFGATEAQGSVGRALMANLIRNPFGGVLFPINPRRPSVLGVKAYAGLADVPGPVDLALVATPAATVPDVLGECLAAGVKAAVVLSAGFGDSGPAGADLERRVRDLLRNGPMRVVGANSFGVACPRTGLNATFAPGMVAPGKVGFLSQSGALLTALLSQEHSERVGCSAFVSVGSLLDVSWAEWLDYLARDPRTECLGIYMERLDDARAFFAAAREVAPHKPVLLVKGGGEPEAPGDEVFEEACRCSGVLGVRRLADLFRVAAHLTAGPAPKGRRLAILTNARGPAVLAADALRGGGGCLAALAPETVAELSGVLTARWNRQNPIDIGDDGAVDRLVRAAAVTARDPNADALLVLVAAQAAMDPVRAAAGLAEVARAGAKPVLACWLWGAAGPESLAALREAGVPAFHSPEAAVRAFGYLWRHAENLRSLADLNAVVGAAEEAVDPELAAGVLGEARAAGRSALTPAEARKLLAAYGLPVQPPLRVADEEEAVAVADALGYPVLLELAIDRPASGDDGEEVRLQAADASTVRRLARTLKLVKRARDGGGAQGPVTVRPVIPAGAVRFGVSSTANPDLGPVIRFGEGGRPGEPPRHPVTAMAPLTPLTAREMLLQNPLSAARARLNELPAELDALERFLLRLSRLAVEQPGVKEITVNPLLVREGRAVAREVRVALQAPRTPR